MCRRTNCAAGIDVEATGLPDQYHLLARAVRWMHEARGAAFTLRLRLDIEGVFQHFGPGPGVANRVEGKVAHVFNVENVGGDRFIDGQNGVADAAGYFDLEGHPLVRLDDV